MRYLHVLQPHEVFVASGVYRYTRDGEALAVREQWTLHDLPGGAQFIRVDEDGREEDGLSILSEALIAPDGTIERFNVKSSNPQDDAIQLLQADYSFNEEYVQIGRSIDGGEREYSEFERFPDSVIYIRQTVFMGHTIRQVLAHGGEQQVFSPQMLSTGDSYLRKMRVESRGEEALTIGSRTYEAHKYQLANDVFYWLDEHDIVLKRRYVRNGQPYECVLTDYAHRDN
jgi:protein involved in ribonucleotide reduction